MTLISSKILKTVISKEKKNNGSIFTIQSKVTGKDYTYRISRNEYKGHWFTHVKVETQYLKFKHLGVYFDGKLMKHGAVVDTPSAKAISYVLNKVEHDKCDLIDSQINLSHEGKCLCCGKTLTDAESIKLGLGPVCASYS